MVDALIDYSDTRAVSEFTVKKDNLFLAGAYFTESGLMENMAQTVALHTGYEFKLRGETAPMGYLGAIKKVEIINLPRVDEKLTTEIRIIHEFSGVTLVDVTVFDVNMKAIALGQMKTVIAT